MSRRDGRRDLRRGALLLAVGIWLLVGTLIGGRLSPGNSWPLLLILLGVAFALTPCRERGGRRFGVLLASWGALAWIAENRIWGLEWHSIGPLVMVTVGILLIWSSIQRQQDGGRAPSPGGDHE